MIEELIKVLDAASGEQVEFVKQAEAQLKLWDDEPGFYTSLLVSVLFVSEKWCISKNCHFWKHLCLHSNWIFFISNSFVLACGSKKKFSVWSIT